jgi:hypothetical protein
MAKVRITDTSKTPRPEVLGGGDPDAIYAQERQGQAELVQSAQLPREGLMNLPEKARHGIKVLRDSPEDPLFVDVELPAGWTKVKTDHDMWSNLLDADGKIVARIFYKAAFYDRRASMRFETA